MNKSTVNIKKFDLVLTIAKVVVDLYDEINVGINDVEIMKAEIEKNVKSYDALSNIDTNINEFQNNMLKDMRDERITLSENLIGKSHAVLDSNKWQIKGRLNDLKNGIESLASALLD